MGLEDLAKIKDLKPAKKDIQIIKSSSSNSTKTVNNNQQNKVISQNLKIDNFPKDGNLKIKITAISPIHIGSGEIYEPTNFIIDNGFLYEFRDEDIFINLPPIKQQGLMNIINDNKSDSFARLHNFIKENSSILKNIAKHTIPVTKELENEYKNKVGKISQIENKNKKVFNKFEIQKTQRQQISHNNKFSYEPYIVGSSFKGAISTAYQEFISQTEGKQSRLDKFENKNKIKEHIFKDFKVSDSIIIKSSSTIGFVDNRERFEDSEDGPYTQIEAIDIYSQFEIYIKYNNQNIKNIIDSCNNHYLPIFKTIVTGNASKNRKDYIVGSLEETFSNKYKNLELSKNQFLIRVGKYSGARAVTIDGSNGDKRNITVKESKYKNISTDEETTTWLFSDNKGLYPFGWLLCEIVN